MSLEVLLVQFLVLAFTGTLWWLARRDLAARASPAAPPDDPRELEQLCVTLEALVTDLADRLEDLEQRLPEGLGALPAVPGVTPAPSVDPAAYPASVPVAMPSAPRPPLREESLASGSKESGSKESGILGSGGSVRLSFPESPPEAAGAEPEISENGSHAALYALLDEGVTDPVEIARRTGLGRGEVDLIMNLRSRRAL